MIKQECIGIPDMIHLLMIFLFQKKRFKQKWYWAPEGPIFNTVI